MIYALDAGTRGKVAWGENNFPYALEWQRVPEFDRGANADEPFVRAQGMTKPEQRRIFVLACGFKL